MRALALTTHLLAALVMTGSALAGPAASDWARSRIADVRLVSAAATTGTAASVPLGLQFRLAEGWKIYWRTPGDAGFPPALRLREAENLESLHWRWPAPERFSLLGFENYGYAGEIVIPIDAALAEPGRPLAIDAAVHALVCKDICVPLDSRVALALPAGPVGPTAFTQLVDRYRARVPGPPQGTGLAAAEVTALSPDAVVVVLTSDRPMVAPDVFIEAAEGYAFGKPSLELAGDGRRAALRLPATVPEGGRLSGQTVTLTVVDGDRFFETPAVIGQPAPPPAPEAATSGLWLTMLGFALLGGLILNLMPCVLPVLSLKLAQVLRYGGSAHGLIRRGFLATAAGIVMSFLALAAGAIALKTAGHAVGWGVQFQQPVFLTVMILILGAFAANLFGWFEIPMPSFSGRLAGIGPENRDGGRALAGHFLSGAFATLLATPCSAPFLGTALGFALSRGAVEILAIFLAMGAGLALPYVLVAAFPGIVGVLPRPGRWMRHLRTVLGLALLATAVWLLTVMAAQLAPGRIAAMAGLLALAAFALLLSRYRRRALAGAATGLAVLVLALGGTARPIAEPGPAPAAAGAPVEWVSFETGRLTQLVAAGQVVLVDVTADWCLTCKVNKSLVLDRGAVAERLAGEGVVAMRADWTRPNAETSAYLASFGRYGIPFNAVYGPSAPDGIALPELLRPDAVLAAFAQAAGESGAVSGVAEPARPAAQTQ